MLRLLKPESAPHTQGDPPAPEPQEESVPKLRQDKRCKSAPLRDPEVTLSQSRSIEGIVTGSHSEAKIAVKNVHADIVRQNDSLKARLKERSKARSSSRPTSPDFMAAPASSYELELELILEHHLIEKQKQITAIKAQFGSQIAEIEALANKSKNGLLTKVVLEMKRSEETAVARAEAELFAKKQEEINALRRKWMK